MGIREMKNMHESPPKRPPLPHSLHHIPSVLLSSFSKVEQQLRPTERSNISKSALRHHRAATIRFRDDQHLLSNETCSNNPLKPRRTTASQQ
jgi:hypothetical protein